MTDYTTRTLAAAVIGEAEVEANPKAATRTLRNFLRAEVKANGGKVGTDTPGKGGRYSITLTKPQVKAMTRRFLEWREAEAKAAEARRAARDAATTETPKVDKPLDPEEVARTVKMLAGDIEDTPLEGPTDEEIAAMLSDDDTED